MRSRRLGGYPAEGPALGAAEFAEIQAVAGRHAGLKLAPAKRDLVRFRLGDRLVASGTDSFAAYLALVRRDPGELWGMIEALANHSTRFYRESDQFAFLHHILREGLRTLPEIRIWSAGCSTGQEPFTLAMLVRHWFPADAGRVRILATDLSRAALQKARSARYTDDQLGSLPRTLRQRFVVPTTEGGGTVCGQLRDAVRLARLNLVDPWPMRRGLHVIFCRNVMLYFDTPTQRAVTARLAGALEPGGYLFLGQLETVPAGLGGLAFLGQSVYHRSVGAG